MNIFRSDTDYGLSPLRLWAMRVPYFLTGVLFSITIWPSLIGNWGGFDPMTGVAMAFWGALSALALFGLRFPIRMLPILLLQFTYKLIWIASVGLPLQARGELDASAQELLTANLIGVVIDTIAIPWLFVIKTFAVGIFAAPKDR